jgi:short-subunit dehydrogenase
MKTAVVVGSSGNLGPIWCDLLEKDGFCVEKFDLPENDVTNEQNIIDFAQNLYDKTPKVVVYNAGIDIPPGQNAGFWDRSAEIVRVNLIGAANITKAFLPYMKANGGGNITYIGSMLGFIASDYRNYPDNFDKNWAYGASKAGLWKLCKDLIVRHSKDGMVFNMLALSGVEGKQSDEFKKKYTAKIPIARMLRREDFENEFLCCVKAKVPYDQPLFVGGGYTIW